MWLSCVPHQCNRVYYYSLWLYRLVSETIIIIVSKLDVKIYSITVTLQLCLIPPHVIYQTQPGSKRYIAGEPADIYTTAVSYAMTSKQFSRHVNVQLQAIGTNIIIIITSRTK